MEWSLAHNYYNIRISYYSHLLQEDRTSYFAPNFGMLFQNGSGGEMIDKETKSNPPLAFMHKSSRKPIGGKCVLMEVKFWLCFKMKFLQSLTQSSFCFLDFSFCLYVSYIGNHKLGQSFQHFLDYSY